MKQIFYLLLAGFILSCNNGKRMAEFSGDSIKIDIANAKPVTKLFDIFESAEYIPLQTDDNCLIGEIDKIIFADDRFYILDKYLSKSVFVFNRNGDFTFQVGKVGQSASEYPAINDFTLNPFTENIEILAGKFILRYDKDGTYLDRIELDMFPDNIEILHNGDYILSTFYHEYRFYIAHPDGKVFWKGLPCLNINKNLPIVEKKQISKTADYVSFKFAVADTVYRFYTDTIKKIFLDFCGHNPPAEKYSNAENTDALQNYLWESNYVALADYFTETDDFCYFFMVFKQKPYSAFISKKTQQMKVYSHNDIVDPFFMSFPLTNLGNNKLVYVVPIADIKGIITPEDVYKIASKEFCEIYDASNEESNPVLMIATLKDF